MELCQEAQKLVEKLNNNGNFTGKQLARLFMFNVIELFAGNDPIIPLSDLLVHVQKLNYNQNIEYNKLSGDFMFIVETIKMVKSFSESLFLAYDSLNMFYDLIKISNSDYPKCNIKKYYIDDLKTDRIKEIIYVIRKLILDINLYITKLKIAGIFFKIDGFNKTVPISDINKCITSIKLKSENLKEYFSNKNLSEIALKKLNEITDLNIYIPQELDNKILKNIIKFHIKSTNFIRNFINVDCYITNEWSEEYE